MEQDVRIDKWLWAARFYKTRALAIEAVKGGKIHLNNVRVKPSKSVSIGAVIKITHNSIERTVVVTGLSAKRGSATIARTLYKESEESIQARLAYKEMMKNASGGIRTDGKPTKKDRRLIHKFKSSI